MKRATYNLPSKYMFCNQKNVNVIYFHLKNIYYENKSEYFWNELIYKRKGLNFWGYAFINYACLNITNNNKWTVNNNFDTKCPE